VQAGWRYNGSFEGNIGYSKIESGNGGEVKQHELCDRTQPPNLKRLILGTRPGSLLPSVQFLPRSSCSTKE
jgi:hypothetical protein